jgi:lipoyl(octanoyl) transferase
MKKFRLIRTKEAGAAFNMALDEAIFRAYLKSRIPVFRIYSWDRPSFTCGVSQDPSRELDLESCRKDNVSFARRMTGGGILLHHDEITYSLSCSKKDIGEPQQVLISYRNICGFLLRFYELLGVEAYFALEDKDFLRKSLPSQICSASYEKYDIMAGAKKIGGNAQKRMREHIFQHGIIPCSIDWDFASKYLKGYSQEIPLRVTALNQLLENVPDKDILEEVLIQAFAEQFGVNFVEEKPSIEEETHALKLIETKYNNPQWNYKRLSLDEAVLA